MEFLETTMKICRKCGIDKSIDDFYKLKPNSPDLALDCKECVKETSLFYYHEIAKERNGVGINMSFQERIINLMEHLLIPIKKCCSCLFIKRKNTDFYKRGGDEPGVRSVCKLCYNK